MTDLERYNQLKSTGRTINLDIMWNIFNIAKTSCNEYIITCQSVFNNNILFDKQILKGSNHMQHNSYEWLFNRIGYYPIWGVKITKQSLRDFHEFVRHVGDSSMSVVNDGYLYLIDASKVDHIDTEYYSWASEIHYIENELPKRYYESDINLEDHLEDEDIMVKNNYDNDWETFLRPTGNDITQSLLKELKLKDIQTIYVLNVKI